MVLITLAPVTINPSQLAFLECLLASYVFALIYYNCLRARPSVPSWAKHLYCFLAGNATLYILLHAGPWTSWLHVYVPVLLTWSACKWMPRRAEAIGPWVLTAAMFAHLGWTHWQRMQHLYLQYVMDHSTVIMVLIIKLSSFAFDMADCRRYEQLEAEERMRLRLVRERPYPSLLAFLGYAFFFPGLVSGPAITYPEYRGFMRRTGAGAEPPEKSIGRRRRALQQFCKAVAFGVGFITFRNNFTHAALLGRRLLARPLWFRLGYVHLANMVSRFMYYTAWLMAEGALVTMGLGYNAESGRWDGCENIRPLGIELAVSPRHILTDWNMATNRWLHRYFYQRFARQLGGRPGVSANMFVKLVSALWHGFYPGYYLMFFSIGLLTDLARAVYRKASWPAAPWLKPFVLWTVCYLLIDYMTVPFVLLTWSESIQFYSNWHWWGHVVTVVGLAVFSLLPERPPRQIAATAATLEQRRLRQPKVD